MLQFNYVSKFNDNFVQFLQEKILEFLILCEFYKCKSCNFSNFISKRRVFSEENLNYSNLLIAANLNR